MAGVLMPQRRDTIGDIAKAVNVAGSLYGIYADTRKLDALEAEQAAKQETTDRRSKGELTVDEYSTILKDFAPTPEGQEPEVVYNVIDPATGQKQRKGLTSRSSILAQTSAEKERIAREDRKAERESQERYRQAMLEIGRTRAVGKAVGPSGEALTPAQVAVDKAFAKTYEDYIASGGSADVEKTLGELQGVSEQLGSYDEQGNFVPSDVNATGPVLGAVPLGIRRITNPQSVALQDVVESAVQRNLRAVLGSQFTEKEGQRLIERAYNPSLSEEENKRRVDRLIKQIAQAAQAKEAAAQYYEQNGTLKGFQGPMYRSANDFLAEERPGVAGQATAAPAKAQQVDLAKDPNEMTEAEIDAQIQALKGAMGGRK